MALTAAQKDYMARMLPYAKMVEAKTGIPAELEVAMWSWETAYGTNSTSKNNNQGGITKGSLGRDGVAGAYATYKTMENYVKDRIRLLNLNMAGYPAVIKAAQAGKSWEEIVKAHNASGWSEDDYNVTTIVNRAREIKGLPPKQEAPAVAAAVCPHCQKSVYLRGQ